MKSFGVTLMILILLALAATLEAWKYGECKKVGHGTAYCLYHFGD